MRTKWLIGVWLTLFYLSICTPQLSAQASADTVASDSAMSIQDSTDLPTDTLAQVSLDELQRQIDSLKQQNRRLSAMASRRLDIDFYVDSVRSQRFYSCMVNPQTQQIQIKNRMGRKGIHTFASQARWADEHGQQLIFAMNAGMFKRNRKAKGLLVSNNQQEQKLDTLTEGYGNFYMQPNGVFALDTNGKAYVLPTQVYGSLADSLSIHYATQSGPMLLVNGEINGHFNDGSPNRRIRNAVGVTANNEVVFAISQTRVTFYELSLFMIQQGCTDALYLDGAISKAYIPALRKGSLASGNALGPIIVIMDK